MRQCIRCKQTKDESEFNVRHIMRNLLQSVCRECQREQARERYANNRDSVREINLQSTAKAQMRAASFIQEYLANRTCTDCGENDITVLTFDHVKGVKKYNISNMITKGLSIRTLQNELAKTEVVCFNCHMRREQRRRGYSRFRQLGA